ncbi:MAG TPA: hypothetical protein ENJ46_02330, partial [Hellea balneolensis]|nr:hypothetical protein [Hellea balneolensis]
MMDKPVDEKKHEMKPAPARVRKATPDKSTSPTPDISSDTAPTGETLHVQVVGDQAPDDFREAFENGQ